MQAFVGNLIQRKPRHALSPEFKHALAREVLKTERLRIITLIITAIVLAAALTTTDIVAPAILDRIWRGHFPLLYVWAGLGGFVLFEASVLALVSRQLKRDLDVPTVRRYLGAFIETSLPSLLLVAHMTNMGAVPALGFVAPLLYFVFIILSTLRLDFWLSTFTGFVAAAEVLGLALLHPAARAAAGDPMLTTGFLISRSAIIFACGVLAGAVGVQLRRQFEASIAAATARDHVTNLFGQHVSPKWWTACWPPARRPAAMRGKSPSCSSTSVALRPQRAPVLRKRLSTDWMQHLRYWSRSSTAMAGS
jgi:adenylate cyclase